MGLRQLSGRMPPRIIPARKLRMPTELPAVGSTGASTAPPPDDVREHEQVHTREKHQGERGHRQEAHPAGISAFKHSHAVEDDGQREGNGQPAMQLPNPFVPVQWFPPKPAKF